MTTTTLASATDAQAEPVQDMATAHSTQSSMANEKGWSVRIKGGARYTPGLFESNILADVEYTCPQGGLTGVGASIAATFEQKTRSGKTVIATTPVGYHVDNCAGSTPRTRLVVMQLRDPTANWDRDVHVFEVTAKIGQGNIVRNGKPIKATYSQDRYCMAASAELC
ncbi:hypothetical protein GCM10009754_11230 [Amycolatopsis minnesotensis]|uniref:Uncharacterized protein n=2 Tax=Amycolatopsis minnesotensis TaxID=337894 RepID=A0ABN2Q8B4_9PSEU